MYGEVKSWQKKTNGRFNLANEIVEADIWFQPSLRSLNLVAYEQIIIVGDVQVVQ